MFRLVLRFEEGREQYFERVLTVDRYGPKGVIRKLLPGFTPLKYTTRKRDAVRTLASLLDGNLICDSNLTSIFLQCFWTPRNCTLKPSEIKIALSRIVSLSHA